MEEKLLRLIVLLERRKNGGKGKKIRGKKRVREYFIENERKIIRLS